MDTVLLVAVADFHELVLGPREEALGLGEAEGVVVGVDPLAGVVVEGGAHRLEPQHRLVLQAPVHTQAQHLHRRHLLPDLGVEGRGVTGGPRGTHIHGLLDDRNDP